jgi:hypothetical protein
METASKLAQVFGASVEWLMTGRGPKYMADFVMVTKDGETYVVEAKGYPLSADSRNSEVAESPSASPQSKRVNNTDLQIARRFSEELVTAVEEKRVSSELLRTLVDMFHLGVAASAPRGDQHHTKMVRSRGNKKRGVGT